MLTMDRPFHGAVLNRRHGRAVEGGLEIEVAGEAPAGSAVTVNGVGAIREGDGYRARVVLRDRETDIVARAESSRGRMERRARVVWDRNSRPRYRFTIDDNIYFLRDVAQKGYASLFECPYLAGLRRIHRKWGTTFSLNCYFTTGSDFSLPQFPDRYKGEWAENAGWLKLAFHAWANDPSRPYEHASAEKVGQDYDRVAGEIVRFAGETAFSPATVIHFGALRRAAWPALAARGVRALSGYFTRLDGEYSVNYSMDDARSEYLSRHDALKDFESGIVFSKVDMVVNRTPMDEVEPALAAVAANPDTAEIMDLLSHEQYCWPWPPHHQADIWERMEAAARFCAMRGYEPVFLHEGFLGVEE